MTRVFRCVAILIVLSFVGHGVKAQGYLTRDQVSEVIVNAVQELSSEIQTRGHTDNLLRFVWEFHHARMAIPHSIETWSYTGDVHFRQTFYKAYMLLMQGLDTRLDSSGEYWNANKLGDLLDENGRQKTMIDAYENGQMHYMDFLGALESYSQFYPATRIDQEFQCEINSGTCEIWQLTPLREGSFTIDEQKRIVMNQARFSVIVLFEDSSFWDDFAAWWSIFAPLSSHG